MAKNITVHECSYSNSIKIIKSVFGVRTPQSDIDKEKSKINMAGWTKFGTVAEEITKEIIEETEIWANDKHLVK